MLISLALLNLVTCTSCGYCCNWEWGIRLPGQYYLGLSPSWAPLKLRQRKSQGLTEKRLPLVSRYANLLWVLSVLWVWIRYTDLCWYGAATSENVEHWISERKTRPAVWAVDYSYKGQSLFMGHWQSCLSLHRYWTTRNLSGYPYYGLTSNGSVPAQVYECFIDGSPWLSVFNERINISCRINCAE